MIDRTQPLADKLIGRLFNGKYESALQYLEGQSLDVVEAVNALSRLFSDTGWVDGDMGSLMHHSFAYLSERRFDKQQWRMIEQAVRQYADAQVTNDDYRRLAEQISAKVDEIDDVD